MNAPIAEEPPGPIDIHAYYAAMSYRTWRAPSGTSRSARKRTSVNPHNNIIVFRVIPALKEPEEQMLPVELISRIHTSLRK